MQYVVHCIVLLALVGNDTAGPNAVIAELHVVIILETVKEQRFHHGYVFFVQLEARCLVGQERNVVHDRPRPAAIVAGQFPLAQIRVMVDADDTLLQIAHCQEGIQLE